jgi:uncharacterized membrane protein
MTGALFLVVLALSLVPLAGFVLAWVAMDTTRTLQRRLEALEAGVNRLKTALPPATGADEMAAQAGPLGRVPAVAPAPAVVQASAHEPAPATTPAIAPATAPVTAQGPAAQPAPAPSAPAPPAPTPHRPLDVTRLEQLIGGIWFQNVGSVLLLLGSFFLILWGYTQGKIGPEILVLAGVVLGVVIAWRGDRISRTIRPLGHAFLGVGLGVVYITLYLGHFRMNVLPEWGAFVLLALVSFVTVDLGLRRSQPAIAALGVAGAFIPLLFSADAGLGFQLPLPGKLGYLAVVNAVVFTLTAIRGWSGLVLVSLLMTSLAWPMNLSGVVWGLPIQLGLSALFTALGVAPVIRLVRTPDPIRRVDLAVVALAPMLLLGESLPFFAANRAALSGEIMAGLGVLNLGAAVWVDSRRSERDLWRPLTAMGTLFITAALERLLTKGDLALAWAVEGAVLVWLGLAPRGGWFRFLGYLVSGCAVLRLLFVAGSYDPASGGGIGIVNGVAIRDLLCIATFLFVSDRIGRRREILSKKEPAAPTVWLIGVNALVMLWICREAEFVARLLATPTAPPPIARGVPSAPWAVATSAPTHPLIVFAWLAQAAAVLLVASWRRARVQRIVGYAIAAASFLFFYASVMIESYWRPGNPPVLYPAGILFLLCVLLFMGIAGYLERRRSTLEASERRIPEIATVTANIALLLWTASEAGHVAYALTPGAALAPAAYGPTAMLSAVIMSAAWVAQAAVLFAMGWVRRSAFLRWLAMGLVGLTLLKFVVFDLQRVDVFWRFVIALGVGAALLLVSFIYQRRTREGKS